MDRPTKWTSMQRKIGMASMQEIPWTMELAINQPFFGLDNQDFARKLYGSSQQILNKMQISKKWEETT